MNGIQLRHPVLIARSTESEPLPRIGARNVKGGLILVSVGLLAGLAMSLYAFQPVVKPPASLDQYDDLPRRLLRLAHIAAIMLPLLNVVLGGWLDRLRLSLAAKRWASWLMLLGAVLVPLALAFEAICPPARPFYPSALPVVAFCAGVFIVSVGALRSDLRLA
jgi:hypothetical protein